MQALHGLLTCYWWAWVELGQHGSTQSNPSLGQITGLNVAKSRESSSNPQSSPLKSGVMGNWKKWCGWRGSNPRPLASEGRTFHWTVVSVSLDFQWFCGGTELCLSGFRKTHRSTQQHVSLLNQTLSEFNDVVVPPHVFGILALYLFETQLFV